MRNDTEVVDITFQIADDQIGTMRVDGDNDIRVTWGCGDSYYLDGQRISEIMNLLRSAEKAYDSNERAWVLIPSFDGNGLVFCQVVDGTAFFVMEASDAIEGGSGVASAPVGSLIAALGEVRDLRERMMAASS